MKSPQEILLECKLDRMREKEAEALRARWMRGCRTPFGIPLWGVIVLPVYAVAVAVLSTPPSRNWLIAFACVIFSRSLFQLVGAFRKREESLIAAIEQDAPALHAKLYPKKPNQSPEPTRASAWPADETPGPRGSS